MIMIFVGSVCCIIGNIGFVLLNGWFIFCIFMFILIVGEILCFLLMNVLMDELVFDSMRGIYYGV